MGFASGHVEAPISVRESKPLSAASHIRLHRIMTLALLLGATAFLMAGTMPIWAGVFGATATVMTPQMVLGAFIMSGICTGLAYLVAE